MNIPWVWDATCVLCTILFEPFSFLEFLRKPTSNTHFFPYMFLFCHENWFPGWKSTFPKLSKFPKLKIRSTNFVLHTVLLLFCFHVWLLLLSIVRIQRWKWIDYVWLYCGEVFVEIYERIISTCLTTHATSFWRIRLTICITPTTTSNATDVNRTLL